MICRVQRPAEHLGELLEQLVDGGDMQALRREFGLPLVDLTIGAPVGLS